MAAKGRCVENSIATIPLKLDGYTDLPPGRIANVVTYLEMTALPSLPRTVRPDLIVHWLPNPELGWYRGLYRQIGEAWLWFSRAVMTDEELGRRLADPATEIHVLEGERGVLGFAELSRHVPGEVEIAMFGVVTEATGTGAARFLMQSVLDKAWSWGVRRVWLHTCTFDHPAALRFYQARGFRPYKLAIEVSEDPRLTGYLPETAGPHVPLIKPAGNRD
jgi:GNAT superfamily N-acetyltransferase